jgi:hypothetical protein
MVGVTLWAFHSFGGPLLHFLFHGPSFVGLVNYSCPHEESPTTNVSSQNSEEVVSDQPQKPRRPAGTASKSRAALVQARQDGGHAETAHARRRPLPSRSRTQTLLPLPALPLPPRRRRRRLRLLVAQPPLAQLRLAPAGEERQRSRGGRPEGRLVRRATLSAARSLAPFGLDIAQRRRRASLGLVRVRFLPLHSRPGRRISFLSPVLVTFEFWCLLLSPRVHWRSSPQGPDGVVLVLVGANVAVYALCRLADPTIMMNHFVVSACSKGFRKWCTSITF